MLIRVGTPLVFLLLTLAPAAGQVVRFQTTVGDFDMVLNPTNNPVLQGYVDNFIRYVENNAYNSSWINRADTGFVLQMGGFYSHTRRPPPTIDSTRPVDTFDPVAGVPAAEIGLSNTIGTVALALPGDGMGGTNEDAGTSSFFINLTSNSFLDPDFTVFAAIPDMAVVNQIMALSTIDRTQDDMFGAGPGNLAFTDVPVQANGFQVLITRAFQVFDPLAIARARSGVQSVVATASGGAGSGATAAAMSAMVVPEPASAAMLFVAIGGFAARFRRRR